MDRYTCFDTASLLSYPFRVALGDYPPTKAHLFLLSAPKRREKPGKCHHQQPTRFHQNPLPKLHDPRTSTPARKSPYDGLEQFHPVQEAGYSYGLIAPFDDSCEAPLHSLERLAEIMFFPKHMLSILNSPYYLVRFREFLLEECPHSLQMLTYYSNTRKALKAIETRTFWFDAPSMCLQSPSRPQNKSGKVSIWHSSVASRKHHKCLQLKNCRYLSQDNPIVFASEKFHRTTQYETDYVLGRNCRFFQGPKTNPNRLRRIKDALEAGKHRSELFLNYHHDGSPFTNILQCAPLCDSQGTVRTEAGYPPEKDGVTKEVVYSHEFRELSELFSPRELEVTHEVGGNLFSPVPSVKDQNWQGRSRACSTADTIETDALRERDIKTTLFRGSLTDVYETVDLSFSFILAVHA
ncbi:uncharacterized protein BDW43DRAFT_308306 [Aspergillus alliaceus]|uniref:uncharacterized protein n=1 Tax=Petromyces alliaceus TaxID=209559 RepID=UPI0012A43BEE|nr:uncharacterized protein BDW43DRAFT_308306 [Aspergillus alliaceus]KAB8236629.1 hypothetical protein BDW43DRAFT_308306 [Aspergillus alliaceus]